jgi:hypothetical protein
MGHAQSTTDLQTDHERELTDLRKQLKAEHAKKLEKKLDVFAKYGGAYVSIRDQLEYEKKELVDEHKIKIFVENGIRLLDLKEGLIIYPEDHPVEFAIKVDFNLSQLFTWDGIQRGVGELFEKIQLVDDYLLLALKLYNASNFEIHPEAKFVVLITIVEILSARIERSNEEIALVNKFLKLIEESNLEKKGKESLTNAVNNLKMESISKACKDLIKRRVDKRSAKLFGELYGISRKILHGGKRIRYNQFKESNFKDKLHELEIVVTRLILSMLNLDQTSWVDKKIILKES